MKLEITEEDHRRIEEVLQQFDPASHLAAQDALQGMNPKELKAALLFMREEIRAELYGNLIWRTALKAAAEHRVASEDAASQSVDDAWNDRYWKDEGRIWFRMSNWGHNLGYISSDKAVLYQSVRREFRQPVESALWVLLDLAVTAMFGPTGNNRDEPTLRAV